MLGKLERERRAVEVRIAGEERWIAAEDAGLYRDALGVPPPGGLPDAFLEPVDGRDGGAGAPLRAHPRPVPDRAARPPLRASTSTPALQAARALRRARPRRAAPGRHASASGATPTSCAGSAAPASRALRQEAEAVDPAELARFLPAWQNVDAHRPAGAGPDRLREALVPLQGVALTPEVWERDVLPRRLGAYSPTWLDQLTTSGEIVWIGAGAAGAHRAGRALLPRGRPPRRARRPSNAKLERPEGEVHDAIRERLDGAPSFWLDLVAELDHRARGAARGALGPGLGRRGHQRRLRAAARPPADRGRPRPAPRAPLRLAPHAAGQDAILGRWSLTETAVSQRARRTGPRLRAQAELMLERYGIVTRETVLAEGVPGRLLGALRRALQPRDARHRPPRLLRRGPRRRPVRARRRGRAPARPAPAGGRVPAPRRDRPRPALRRRAARGRSGPRAGARPATPGAYVLLRDGDPIVYVERGGKGIVRLVELEGEALVEAIARLAEAARDEG